jgi:hypothetical protein
VGLLKVQFACLKDAQLPTVVAKCSNGLCVLRKGHPEGHFYAHPRFQRRNPGVDIELTRGLDIPARQKVLIPRHPWASCVVSQDIL